MQRHRFALTDELANHGRVVAVCIQVRFSSDHPSQNRIGRGLEHIGEPIAGSSAEIQRPVREVQGSFITLDILDQPCAGIAIDMEWSGYQLSRVAQAGRDDENREQDRPDHWSWAKPLPGRSQPLSWQ